MIASLALGKAGVIYQKVVCQGVFSSKVPARAGAGQKRSQCWTELSPDPHNTQGCAAQSCRAGDRKVREEWVDPSREVHKGEGWEGRGGCDGWW